MNWKAKVAVWAMLGSVPLWAHFQMVIPSSDILEEGKGKLGVEVMFAHPFEQSYMEMKKPQAFGYVLEGKKHSLLEKLAPKSFEGKGGFSTELEIKEAGTYRFYVEPMPYFEPAEKKFIKHLTQVTVDAFGADEGWDKPLGMKAEIVPLARPYGLYAGNLFQGQVLFKGKPVAGAEVEVELYNTKGYKAPSESHITQVVKADKNGIFTYAMPVAGWWGFSALLEDDVKLKHSDGKEYPVELGAVIWMKAYELK